MAKRLTRREWLGGALLGAQLLLLAACGGDDEDDYQEAPAAPQGSVPQPSKDKEILTIAMFRRQGPMLEAIRQLNEGRVADIPANIELQDAELTFSATGNLEATQEAFVGALSARVSAGTVPDLMVFAWQADFPWLFKSSLLQPLDRFIQNDANQPLEQFFPQSVKLVRFQGQTMALPTRVTAGVAQYLPELFSQANIAPPQLGWTRDDFAAAAKQLTQDTNGDGTVDQWGFGVSHFYADWLPFVLHETGKDVIDLETGAVHLTDPAALRGLQYWDDLGRVHKIMRYVQEISSHPPGIRRPYRPSSTGILFETAFEISSTGDRETAPIPAGPMAGTPLMLFDVTTIPAGARDPDLSYSALVPLALHFGERSRLPTVKTSLEHITTPGSRDHLNILFLEHQREVVLDILNNARPSWIASSNAINSWLLNNLTLPLARGEVTVEQAARQAQNWLQSYISE